MVAFAFAWTCLFTQPVAIAAVARGFADYLSELFPMTEALTRTTAAGAIAVFAAIAIRSTPVATRLEGMAAMGKLLALLTCRCHNPRHGPLHIPSLQQSRYAAICSRLGSAVDFLLIGIADHNPKDSYVAVVEHLDYGTAVRISPNARHGDGRSTQRDSRRRRGRSLRKPACQGTSTDNRRVSWNLY